MDYYILLMLIFLIISTGFLFLDYYQTGSLSEVLNISKKKIEQDFPSTLPKSNSTKFSPFLLEMVSFFGGLAIILAEFSRDGMVSFIFLYPCCFAYLLIWNRIFRKQSLLSLFGGKIKIPEKSHRWFGILVSGFMLFFILRISNILLVNQLDRTNLTSLYLQFNYSVIQAPIIEELIFRGYFYSRFRSYNETTGKMSWASFLVVEMVFNGVLFGFWHYFDVVVALQGFFFGMFLAKTRNEWGNSLVMPIILHFLLNLVNFLLLYT